MARFRGDAGGGWGRFWAAVGVGALIAVGSVVAGTPAWAVAPGNDDFSAATVLPAPLPIDVSGSSSEATKEPGEPAHGGDAGGASVWFSWTPSVSGAVVIDTCGSNYWANLGVYTGTAVGSLTTVGADPELCEDSLGSSRLVRLAAVAGTTYRIAVDGQGGATGGFGLHLRSAPANDQFAAAQALNGVLPVSVTSSTFGATREAGEPTHAGQDGGHSIWFAWTPANSGPVTVSTCASDFDTLLGIYRGTALTALTPVAANDNGCGEKSSVSFAAAAGTTYKIAVDGPVGELAAAMGTVRLVIRAAAPPANDNFEEAQVLGQDLPVAVTGSTVDATAEAGDPAPLSGGRSVWYSWSAGFSGQVTVNTCLSNFDTLLAVYTGSAIGDLTALASNDDTCGTSSSVRFQATAGTTYRIAVDGYHGATGQLQLKLIRTPANDDFAEAQELTGSLPITAAGTNVGATQQPGEPEDSGGGGATVWYRWTPAATGQVTLSTCASQVTTKLAVYTGDELTGLTAVSVSDLHCGARAKVSFTATAGTTYRIQVDGSAYSDGSALTGPIGLTIRTSTPPANDDFAAAEALPSELPVTVTGSTADSTQEPGDPLGAASVWYRWTPSTSGSVVVSSCGGTGLDTQSAVYTGSTLSDLAALPGQDGCRSTVTVTAGTEYRIAVAGQAPNEFRPFTLTLRAAVRPANDDFAHAQDLTGPLPFTANGNNSDATTEPDEPDGAAASVWYRWTATATGPVSFDTCDSGRGLDSTLTVYTGTAIGELDVVVGSHADCGSLSRMIFAANSGTTYRIRVGGSVLGAFRLRVRVPNPPSNDDVADARVLTGSLPLATNGTNVEATREATEPSRGELRGYASVWYRWTPASSGRVMIDTCDSDFDTQLAVYTGSSPTSQIVANDNGCGAPAAGSKVTFAATAGTTYWIVVDGTADNMGSPSPEGSFTLQVKAADRPDNDDRAQAAVLSGALPVARAGTTVGATKEPGEGRHVGNDGGASVWYSWTPAASGPVTIDTCDAGFATLVAVYRERSDGVSVVVSSNRNGCGQGSRDTFVAAAGTEYLIAVDGMDGAQGTFTLRLRSADTPANDNFADATELTAALPIAVTGTNREATREPNEPAHDGTNGGASVWYRWVAPAAGPVSIDTCGSDFDTVLGVYTGSAVNALAKVASDDNTCGTRSQVSFEATAGTTYWIAVDGPVRNVGTIRLAIHKVVRPANDNFADARPLTGTLPLTTDGTTIDASREPSEPLHGGVTGTASVWYRWTAPAAGKVVVETCGSGFDTTLGVYTGVEVGDLSTVAFNGDACGAQSRVEFGAAAGRTYWIAVDGAGGAVGAVRLTVRPPQRPVNDAFAAAQSLSGALPIAVTGSTVDATRENGESAHGQYSHGTSVWYSWTPSSNRRVTIDTCASQVNTVIGVYSGSTLATLAEVASADDGCGHLYGGSKVTFTATAGTTYRIAVDGWTSGVAGAFPGTGEFRLALTGTDPPANDDLAAAQVLTGTLPMAITGTNAGATREPGEPFHAGFVGGTSVWYSWTPTLSGRVSIDTCSSSFDTLLAVYTEPGLTAVAANNNGCGSASKVAFTASAGTTYRIAVDGRDESTGMISLALVDLEPRVTTVTQVTSAPAPSAYGQAATFTASVTGGATPTGAVQFAVDGTDSGAPRPLSAGKATLSLSTLAVGSHVVTARYGGDAGHTPSSGSVTHRVDKMVTKLIAHPAVLEVLPLRISLRLSATLVDATGHAIPGQPVRFVVAGRTACTATTSTTGVATCSSLGAWLLAVLTLGYDTYYDGTPTHQPTQAHGTVLG